MNLNEITNPDSWDNPDWTKYLDELQLQIDKGSMHRKFWEFAQTVYGLDILGFLDKKFIALDVGAGKDRIQYYLANKLSHVYATDLYGGEWEDQSPSDFVDNPKKYAPFPYDESRLTAKKMDARKLEFDDNTFDIVFSISSIEHFGGHKGSQKSMEEIARVLKPGGIAAIVTECILNDTSRIPSINRAISLLFKGSYYQYFTPKELDTFLIKPSGLELVEPIKFDQPSLESYLKNPVKLPKEISKLPHIVLKAKDDVVFTSVMMFLRKNP